ncbi:hypothetical protein PHISCL_09982 [Aspergillus sclerotialis]|uniref:NDT80 domain-containing protein n=1 Tax=Aspergillus sclerotialis TaxID=2070753 RepID=A0A3A2ZKJ4_9EURO|nr:hypothetical protein PHISCL_09982 [Aspergillus sclerotialis]
MADFRSRVPTLQPPAGMSPSMQSQHTTIPSNTGMLNRGDNLTYSLHRGQFSPLSNPNDMTRFSYTSTPRALENTVDRPQNMVFGPTGNMLMDPAPRIQQLVDAPPFHETNTLHQIVSGNQTVKPEIWAKIHKGFFQADDKWTCYRRNYFSVSCSFTLNPFTPSPLFLKLSDHQGAERIRSFSMSISAIVNGHYGEIRELVQHTPKRDKQSERRPGKIPLQPTQPGRGSNNSQLGFSLGSPTAMDYTSYGSTPQPTQPPMQHTFERIQFQKATANNGKRRAQQQYYNLVVELYAEISNPVAGCDSQWIKIARKQSHPMVVRGRSPGHYKDGRRDSTTSMGPDGGSGAAGDGSGAVLPPSIGPTARSHLGLMSYDTSQRSGTHYGRGDYRQIGTEQFPPSGGSPLLSSSSSSAFDINIMNDSMDPMDTMKGVSSMDSYNQDPTFAVTSPDRKLDGAFRGLNYDYNTLPKTDESGTSFAESFDTIVPTMSNSQGDTSHYLKPPGRLASQTGRLAGIGSYDPVFSPRPTEGNNAFGRFDPIHGTQSICT